MSCWTSRSPPSPHGLEDALRGRRRCRQRPLPRADGGGSRRPRACNFTLRRCVFAPTTPSWARSPSSATRPGCSRNWTWTCIRGWCESSGHAPRAVRRVTGSTIVKQPNTSKSARSRVTIERMPAAKYVAASIVSRSRFRPKTVLLHPVEELRQRDDSWKDLNHLSRVPN